MGEKRERTLRAYINTVPIAQRMAFSNELTNNIAAELERKRGNSKIRWLTFNQTWFYNSLKNNPHPVLSKFEKVKDYPYDIVVLRALHCNTYLLFPAPNFLIYHMTGESALATLHYFMGRFTPEKFDLKIKKDDDHVPKL